MGGKAITAALKEADVDMIVEMNRRRPERFADCQTPWNDAQFLWGYFVFVKGQILRHGDLSAPEHLVEIPRKAWSRFPASSKNRESAHYYDNRKDMLEALGILESARVSTMAGQCRDFRVRFQFAAGQGQEIDSLEALEAYLRRTLPADEIEAFFAKKSAKKYRPRPKRRPFSRRFLVRKEGSVSDSESGAT